MSITVHSARWQTVTAPHGIAALRYTHWLDEVPRAVEGVAGEWFADADGVHGRGVDAADIDLAPFETREVGDLLVRAFARDGALALRIYDPEAPGRVELRGIEVYPDHERWAVAGRFVPMDAGAQRIVRSVDGHERTVAVPGTIALEVDGHAVNLVVSDEGDGLSAVIADQSVLDGAYAFRFLPIDAPDADGAVTVDFRRAYLPPCAFSDQYVCPLPPPENRLPFAVTAGEKRALRG
ncbi:DUF1684 domain-containing protein [Microbacterium sp. MC2]